MNELMNAVKELKGGSAAAFQLVYEQTRTVALAVIRKYCDNPSDHEDILQETYLKVYKYIGQLDDDEKIQPWINRIAANTAVRYNMKKKPMMFSELAGGASPLDFRRAMARTASTRISPVVNPAKSSHTSCSWEPRPVKIWMVSSMAATKNPPAHKWKKGWSFTFPTVASSPQDSPPRQANSVKWASFRVICTS